MSSPNSYKVSADLLARIEEYLQDHEDVRDGSDGPRPNEAMQLLTDLRYEMAYPSGPSGEAENALLRNAAEQTSALIAAQEEEIERLRSSATNGRS